MLWLKISTGIARHPKTVALAQALRISPQTAVGGLVQLFGHVLEVAPDGVVQKWDDHFFITAFGCRPPKNGPDLSTLLLRSGFLDSDPLRVHNWLEYAGPYLIKKLGGGKNSAGAVELRRIWKIYGLDYGRAPPDEERAASESQATCKRPVSDSKATIDEIRLDLKNPNCAHANSQEGEVREVVPGAAVYGGKIDAGFLNSLWSQHYAGPRSPKCVGAEIFPMWVDLLARVPGPVIAEAIAGDRVKREPPWDFCKRLEANQKPKNGTQKPEQTAAERAAETRRRLAEEMNL